jgi:hypothetical protein
MTTILLILLCLWCIGGLFIAGVLSNVDDESKKIKTFYKWVIVIIITGPITWCAVLFTSLLLAFIKWARS